MQMLAEQISIRKLSQMGLGVPVLLLLLLVMMILPLPPLLLDLLFTFNIALSLLVLLSGIYALRPLDFGSFPTVLLIATLLRLALNIASTRVVLLYGHMGDGAAGQVIRAFGEVVIGGNYIVGFVVFSIFIIINFIVITKGAGRISEVSARFTLDAMPGKQMAIDADLNAGTLTQEEARVRREEVSKEADFYGAMDGSSKFIRGDAIAGILILFINLIGGTLVGIFQHDLTIVDALHSYALLTIGDGLVAQIPALILSTAAAIIVTRVSSSENISNQIVKQVFGNSKSLIIASLIIIGLGVIPGMPHFSFLLLGALVGGSGVLIEHYKQALEQKNQLAEEQAATSVVESGAREVKELDWGDVPVMDPITLEIGVNLISLVDKEKSGELLSRVRGVRKKLSSELGFLIPAVRIKDSMDLNPNAYKISILGVVVGDYQVYPDRLLAINPGQVFGRVEGLVTKDPAFQLDAVWIEPIQKEQAQTLGYTVVDTSTVIATHINQMIQERSYQLLGHDEVQKLIDLLGNVAPKLVEHLVPKTLSVSVVTKVLQNLLQEHVPIRDMRSIAESLTHAAVKTQDPDALTAVVRIALGQLIVQQISGFSSEISAITLSPDLEQLLQKSLQSQRQEQMMLEPGLAEKIQVSIQEIYKKYESSEDNPVLMVGSAIRAMFSKFVRSFLPSALTLSYQEIPQDKKIRIIGIVGGQ